MHHDLLAELAGYRNELAIQNAAGNTGVLGEIRAEIDRVTGLITGRADALDTKADTYLESGSDVRGAEARVEARRLRTAAAPATENTAQSAPRETATTRRGRRAQRETPAPAAEDAPAGEDAPSGPNEED